MISANSVWLSNDIIESLFVINQILVDMYVNSPGFNNLNYQQVFDIGIGYNEPMNAATQKLYEIFFRDIKELDNIRLFRKNKNS